MIGMFDPLGLLLVIGGAALIAGLQTGQQCMAAALQSGAILWRARTHADAQDAAHLIAAANKLAARSGRFALDQLRPAHATMAAMLDATILAHCPRDAHLRLARIQSDATAAQRDAAHFWGAVADAAPALGMAGTVIGMIRLFGDTGAASGQSMAAGGLALALHTTLYGLLLASLIAGPIAARLNQLADADAAWQSDLAALCQDITQAHHAGC